MESRRFYVITGGTMVHVAPHFSLCAPAYGKVGEQIADRLHELFTPYEAREFEPGWAHVQLVRTRMACGTEGHSAEEKDLFAAAGIKFLETNEDLEKLVDHLVLQPDTRGIVMAAAVCDWKPTNIYVGNDYPSELYDGYKIDKPATLGKKHPRLQTSWGDLMVRISPADKLISKIRKVRKDIFLVGFKATTGMSEQEQYITGLGLLKGASCNLVLANDVHEHRNMVVTPEEAKYHVTKDRKAAIKGLCEMIVLRSQLHFTRSTVVEGEPIPWDGEEVPANLRKVVDHCIARGAYKPFQGKTVGHFATRGPKDGIIYTSRRKSDFNNLAEDGLLRIDAIGDDRVIAHGAKPSVGGQSQRIIFTEHPDVDCIVHFHCPLRSDKRRPFEQINVRKQRPFECGSHECGQNTSDGLREIVRTWGERSSSPLVQLTAGRDTGVSQEPTGIKAVMLDEHGPNIGFSKDADPRLIIEFIEEYWDLEAKTGGPVSLEAS